MQPYSTFWKNDSMNSESFTSANYYNMVMGTALGNSTYWLSTRWADRYYYGGRGTFGLGTVSARGMSGARLYVTDRGAQQSYRFGAPSDNHPTSCSHIRRNLRHRNKNDHQRKRNLYPK